MNKLTIGIDPGISGAIACLSPDGKLLFAVDMPIVKVGKKNQIHESAVWELLDEQVGLSSDNIEVCIEKSQAMPGQGVSSMFNYGLGYGILRGICVGMRIPYTLVHPKTWKKLMMADMPKEKEASIVRVNQLYPEFTELTRRKDHGKADAILIARWLQNHGV